MVEKRRRKGEVEVVDNERRTKSGHRIKVVGAIILREDRLDRDVFVPVLPLVLRMEKRLGKPKMGSKMRERKRLDSEVTAPLLASMPAQVRRLSCVGLRSS